MIGISASCSITRLLIAFIIFCLSYHTVYCRRETSSSITIHSMKAQILLGRMAISLMFLKNAPMKSRLQILVTRMMNWMSFMVKAARIKGKKNPSFTSNLPQLKRDLENPSDSRGKDGKKFNLSATRFQPFWRTLFLTKIRSASTVDCSLSMSVTCPLVVGFGLLFG